MSKAERQGLCQDASLEIFVQWYTFGGIQRGLTLTEIMAMPTWLRKDFRYILSTLSTRRKEREREGIAFEKSKKPRRGKRNAR